MIFQTKHPALYLSFLLSTILLSACGGNTETNSLSQSTTGAATAPMTQLERGQIIFKRCQACHTLGKGEIHKVGPNLHGLFGSVSGVKSDFNYSKAMKAADVIWTDETLDTFLIRPSDFIPGNRMSFIGLKKEEDRSAVIAYMELKTNGNASKTSSKSP